jgi:hypothetical protein
LSEVAPDPSGFFFERDGVIYLPVKATCERLQIPLRPQLARIKRDPLIRGGSLYLVLATKGGKQSTLCLSVPAAIWWLARLNVQHNARAQAMAAVCAKILAKGAPGCPRREIDKWTCPN